MRRDNIETIVFLIISALVITGIVVYLHTSNSIRPEQSLVNATKEVTEAEVTEADSSVQREELTEDIDTFEWLYKFLNSREAKLVTEGESITIKKQLAERDDDLATLIKGSGGNIFKDTEETNKFYGLYYSYLERNRDAEWLDKVTRDYFKAMDSVEIKEDADIKETILAMDKGTTEVATPERYKYLVYGLLANQMGFIEKMPYYDAASILYKLDECSKEHTELDSVFIELRSKYNGIQ